MKRQEIVIIARDWLGTPYRHQASRKHVGTDCLGLLRGVWREMLGDEPEAAPPYTPDWAEAFGEDTLLQAARRHLVEIPVAQRNTATFCCFAWGWEHQPNTAPSSRNPDVSFMPIGAGPSSKRDWCRGGRGGSLRRSHSQN